MEIVTTDYLLASVLHDVINIIQMRLGEKTIAFVTDIDEALPSKLLGDEVRIRQVLLNMLTNAVKYTNEGSVTFSAHGNWTELREISGTEGGVGQISLVFEVADTGIGIKAEDMGKLFGEFEQFDAKTNKNVEGTGLGLAITKRLCVTMGGDITVTSEYGKGSVFTAVIPQTVIDNRPIGVKHTFSQDTNEVKATAFRFVAPTATILLVDDNSTNLKVAEGLLAPYKMQIDSCLSGEESIELVQQKEYDIIFMDHMMIGMDGVEATQIIRKTHSETPIIALTANAISGMREMFLENQFSDYLAKPIEISKLNEMVAKWLPQEKREKPVAPEVEVAAEVVATETVAAEVVATEVAAEIGTTEVVATAAELQIEGVDIATGIRMTGGTEKQYVQILGLYCKDVLKRVELMDAVPSGAEETKAFIVYVHALKSASASIGASEISEEAKALEIAGRNEDFTFITEHLSGFKERQLGLVERITAVVSAYKAVGAQTAKRKT
jgi:CheY-like chemotaxis protein/HPt (histidine-containing phosphotransfer) domain-containing protein